MPSHVVIVSIVWWVPRCWVQLPSCGSSMMRRKTCFHRVVGSMMLGSFSPSEEVPQRIETVTIMWHFHDVKEGNSSLSAGRPSCGSSMMWRKETVPQVNGNTHKQHDMTYDRLRNIKGSRTSNTHNTTIQQDTIDKQLRNTRFTPKQHPYTFKHKFH